VNAGQLAWSYLRSRPLGTLLNVLLLALGIAQFFAGWGVRGLRSWGRIIGCVVSGIGLLGFPIGTVVNGYILYLYLSKKGRTIFAPEYQDVIAATPHVKYRASETFYRRLALVILALVAIVSLPR